MNVLITSGGTIIPIDDVRRITNMSSGKFGSKIATAFLKNKTHTIHLHSKDGVSPFNISLNLMEKNINIQELNDEISNKHDFWYNYRMYYSEHIFRTFDQYQTSLKSLLEDHKPEITILSAAISDYGMNATLGKISSNEDEIILRLKKLPKVINKVKEWYPETYLVGFKLLSGSTHDDLINAATKLEKQSNADLIVANDLNDLKAGNHRLYLIKDGSIIKTLDRTKNLEYDLHDFIYTQVTSR